MPNVAPLHDETLHPSSSAIARAFLDPVLPIALRPTEQDRLLHVALVWGEQVLDVESVSPRIGQTRAIPLTEGLLAKRLTPHIRRESSGDWALLVPQATQLTVIRRNGPIDLPALLGKGRASPVEVPIRGARYVLGLDDRVEIASGDVRLVARHFRPERADRRPYFARVEPALYTAVVVATLCLAFVLGIFRLERSLGPDLDDDLLRHPPITKSWVANVRIPPPVPVGGGTNHPAPRGPAGRPRMTSTHSLLAKTTSVTTLIDLFGHAARRAANSSVSDELRNAIAGIQGPAVAAIDGPGFNHAGTGPGGVDRAPSIFPAGLVPASAPAITPASASMRCASRRRLQSLRTRFS